MDKLVADLRVAMRKRLEGLQWMGPETKKEALAKLANFGLKIGHPDEWRDYSALQIRNGDLFGNVERAYFSAMRSQKRGSAMVVFSVGCGDGSKALVKVSVIVMGCPLR